MKIKIEQLDEQTRRTIALAVELYAGKFAKADPATCEKYLKMVIALRHGELLLCEYVYNEKESEVQS